jgi:hypothetical protein
MSRVKAILVCLDQADPKWELPVDTGRGVERCMIGWVTDPPPVDAGVPAEVAQILAGVLVKHAVANYPRKINKSVSISHAVTVEQAQPAFEDDYFDWTQRGQVILLSPPNVQPPAISERSLEVARDPSRLHRLCDDGFSGVMLPGVDGDVAGIYTCAAGLRDALLDSLESACRDMGAQFHRVTEDQFADALAQS